MKQKTTITKILYPVFVLLLMTLCIIGARFTADRESGRTAFNHAGKSIISLAPSITETVFKLGAGEQLVGVTKFCDYPPEAQLIQKVGGYLDVNYEAVISLKPGIVILLEEHEKAQDYFTNLGIPFLTVNHKTVKGILESFEQIGAVVEAEEPARELAKSIRERLRHIQTITKNQPRPRIIISIGRFMGAGNLQDVYFVGSDSFYTTIIEIAGGHNVVAEAVSSPYPKLSREAIMRLDPEIIIDFVPEIQQQNFSREDILQDWQAVSETRAVREGKVYLLDESFSVVPGPRFILLAEQMARLLHPELEWMDE